VTLWGGAGVHPLRRRVADEPPGLGLRSTPNPGSLASTRPVHFAFRWSPSPPRHLSVNRGGGAPLRQQEHFLPKGRAAWRRLPNASPRSGPPDEGRRRAPKGRSDELSPPKAERPPRSLKRHFVGTTRPRKGRGNNPRLLRYPSPRPGGKKTFPRLPPPIWRGDSRQGKRGETGGTTRPRLTPRVTARERGGGRYGGGTPWRDRLPSFCLKVIRLLKKMYIINVFIVVIIYNRCIRFCFK
jgi:hypothetical protein